MCICPTNRKVTARIRKVTFKEIRNIKQEAEFYEENQ
jgi:hypothetical protein